MALVTCPFCIAEIDAAASVCPVCSRDIAIPPSLIAEHEELLRKRERLMAELADARRKLKDRRRREAGEGTASGG